MTFFIELSAKANGREEIIASGKWSETNIVGRPSTSVGEAVGDSSAHVVSIDLPRAFESPGTAERTIFLNGLNTYQMASYIQSGATFSFRISEFQSAWNGLELKWSDLVERWHNDMAKSVIVLLTGKDGAERLFQLAPVSSKSIKDFMREQIGDFSVWKTSVSCPAAGKLLCNYEDLVGARPHDAEFQVLKSVNFLENWRDGWVAKDLSKLDEQKNLLELAPDDYRLSLIAGNSIYVKFLSMKALSDSISFTERHTAKFVF